MPTEVLIADPDTRFLEGICNDINQTEFVVKTVDNGRDVQRNLYKGKFHSVFLNWNLKAHSAVEVLNYIKSTNPFLRVHLLFDQDFDCEKVFKPEDYVRMGVASYIKKPIDSKQLKEIIRGESALEIWRKVENDYNGPKKLGNSKDVFSALDDQFIAIPIKDFFSGNFICFNLYLKLTSGRYILLFKRGDSFDLERLN